MKKLKRNAPMIAVIGTVIVTPPADDGSGAGPRTAAAGLRGKGRYLAGARQRQAEPHSG